MKHNENSRAKIPTLVHLTRLGYEYADLKTAHTEWLRKVKKDIADQNSPADIALKEFFEGIEFIPSAPDLVQRAVLRFNIGNPPGKDRKYGDAINWETLLESVPDGEDLFFYLCG